MTLRRIAAAWCMLAAWFCWGDLLATTPLRGLVYIETREGAVISVPVERAETAPQRSRGLQDRDELPTGSGMWFDFGRSGPVAMWMKDTRIPLDMIFVDAGCRVVHQVEGAVPGSLQILGPEVPVRWVLEVNAGFVSERGVRLGDCIWLESAVGVERGEGLGKPLQ